MSRSHAVLLGSALFVGVGSSVALSSLFLQGPQGLGPLPKEAFALPAETRLVSGIDVKKLVASPLYKKNVAMRPAALAEIKSRTGLDPERDIDRAVLANTSGRPDAGVIFIFGTFSLPGLTKEIQSGDHKNVTEKKIGGETLFSYEDAKGVSVQVVLLNEHVVLLGTGAAVQTVAANVASGATPLRNNKVLVGLIGRLPTTATFWMAGDGNVLADLPKSLPGSQSGNVPSMNLPTLQSLTAFGDLDPAVVVNLEADAVDAAAAKNLGDIVRGFLAIASMQAAQKPALQGLATAVNVTNDQNKVLVSARLPYELLDALQHSVAPAPPAH